MRFAEIPLPRYDDNYVISDDWFDDAACLTEDSDLFLGRITVEQTKQAKAICDRCPVLKDCAYDSVKAVDVWTYRAAMAPKDRLFWLAEGNHEVGRIAASKIISVAHNRIDLVEYVKNVRQNLTGLQEAS